MGGKTEKITEGQDVAVKAGKVLQDEYIEELRGYFSRQCEASGFKEIFPYQLKTDIENECVVIHGNDGQVKVKFNYDSRLKSARPFLLNASRVIKARIKGHPEEQIEMEVLGGITITEQFIGEIRVHDVYIVSGPDKMRKMRYGIILDSQQSGTNAVFVPFGAENTEVTPINPLPYPFA